MARGDGRTFQRGDVWWVSFYRNGSEVRESTGVRGEPGAKAASKLLRRRLTEMATGQYLGPQAERVTVGEVLDGWLGDLRLRGCKSAHKYSFYVTRMKAALDGDRRVANLGTPTVQAWMQDELDAGAARGTVKTMAAILGAAIRWAYRTQMVARVPYIPSIKVNNARQGFVDDAQAQRLVAALHEPYSDVLRFAITTGWRSSEYLPLTWDRVDRVGREIRLTTSKNGDGRVVPIAGDLVALIERRWRDRAVGCQHVFHAAGLPIPYARWRYTFTGAARSVGLATLTPHDLRRTAVRNLSKAGVPDKVGMLITGHKSRTMYDRYRIVPTDEMAEALTRTERGQRGQVVALSR